MKRFFGLFNSKEKSAKESSGSKFSSPARITKPASKEKLIISPFVENLLTKSLLLNSTETTPSKFVQSSESAPTLRYSPKTPPLSSPSSKAASGFSLYPEISATTFSPPRYNSSTPPTTHAPSTDGLGLSFPVTISTSKILEANNLSPSKPITIRIPDLWDKRLPNALPVTIPEDAIFDLRVNDSTTALEIISLIEDKISDNLVIPKDRFPALRQTLESLFGNTTDETYRFSMSQLTQFMMVYSDEFKFTKFKGSKVYTKCSHKEGNEACDYKLSFKFVPDTKSMYITTTDSQPHSHPFLFKFKTFQDTLPSIPQNSSSVSESEPTQSQSPGDDTGKVRRPTKRWNNSSKQGVWYKRITSSVQVEIPHNDNFNYKLDESLTFAIIFVMIKNLRLSKEMIPATDMPAIASTFNRIYNENTQKTYKFSASQFAQFWILYEKEFTILTCSWNRMYASCSWRSGPTTSAKVCNVRFCFNFDYSTNAIYVMKSVDTLHVHPVTSSVSTPQAKITTNYSNPNFGTPISRSKSPVSKSERIRPVSKPLNINKSELIKLVSKPLNSNNHNKSRKTIPFNSISYMARSKFSRVSKSLSPQASLPIERFFENPPAPKEVYKELIVPKPAKHLITEEHRDVYQVMKGLEPISQVHVLKNINLTPAPKVPDVKRVENLKRTVSNKPNIPSENLAFRVPENSIAVDIPCSSACDIEINQSNIFGKVMDFLRNTEKSRDTISPETFTKTKEVYKQVFYNNAKSSFKFTLRQFVQFLLVFDDLVSIMTYNGDKQNLMIVKCAGSAGVDGKNKGCDAKISCIFDPKTKFIYVSPSDSEPHSHSLCVPEVRFVTARPIIPIKAFSPVVTRTLQSGPAPSSGITSSPSPIKARPGRKAAEENIFHFAVLNMRSTASNKSKVFKRRKRARGYAPNIWKTRQSKAVSVTIPENDRFDLNVKPDMGLYDIYKTIMLDHDSKKLIPLNSIDSINVTYSLLFSSKADETFRFSISQLTQFLLIYKSGFMLNSYNGNKLYSRCAWVNDGDPEDEANQCHCRFAFKYEPSEGSIYVARSDPIMHIHPPLSYSKDGRITTQSNSNGSTTTAGSDDKSETELLGKRLKAEEITFTTAIKSNGLPESGKAKLLDFARKVIMDDNFTGHDKTDVDFLLQFLKDMYNKLHKEDPL